MRNIFKSLAAILIVVSMVFTLGVESISQENDIIEQEVKMAPQAISEVEPAEEVKPEPEVVKPPEQLEEAPKVEQKEEPKKEKPVIQKSVIQKPVQEEVQNTDVVPDEEADEEELEDLEDPEESEEDEELDPLDITLTDAETKIEDPIKLGAGNDPNGENYMSEAAGGDGNYSYEWRIEGEEEVFSEEENPEVQPEEDTKYELTLEDSSEEIQPEIETMKLEVLPPKGTLTITNKVEKQRTRDANQRFDIFIDGPDGSLYTVSLKNGESVTLENLERGKYNVSSITPMNYKSVEIVGKRSKITKGNFNENSTVRNIRTNNFWFYSE